MLYTLGNAFMFILYQYGVILNPTGILHENEINHFSIIALFHRRIFYSQ